MNVPSVPVTGISRKIGTCSFTGTAVSGTVIVWLIPARPW
ncbi:Uncharacterised protein [Mycobacterium tuberculosis]|uniref:Uncharacterized protein n=1 Tax=Mycobacterium tuberculosis TaxID=1773 RepID=A0A654TVN5_MYCTX|nr:Uncharacterised protein [Mycobacterium tuberculosis]CFS43947.1 Uncharacterised protein [Mycobacterium tuberculosis]CKS82644.1 Uncharacterised protein [Mycobacterium tuberculosis]COW61415.1 Uncharacterised protein [Mycobacterium tuberculosis]COX40340.1 Uncharacterised protein [Mycobacterium tuberculosis]